MSSRIRTKNSINKAINNAVDEVISKKRKFQTNEAIEQLNVVSAR